MSDSHGHNILSVFDASEDELDFLASLIDDGVAPTGEVRIALHSSLTAGAEDWQSLIDCARILRDRSSQRPTSFKGHDVLTYVPIVLSSVAPEAPWARTDRLVALAKQLGEQARAEIPSLKPHIRPTDSTARQGLEHRSKRPKPGHTSPFWSVTSDNIGKTTPQVTQRQSTQITRVTDNAPYLERKPADQARTTTTRRRTDAACQVAPSQISPVKRAAISPYFHDSGPPASRTSPRRPAPGIVSSVPFPPLDAPSFGLIQERQAHEPFWLLIAVTFLIKTRGTVAVPVFERVKAQFPSPADIADPENAEVLMDMIRPLGLAKNRLAFLQKYANGFLKAPPSADRRYRVPGYDLRDLDPRETQAGDLAVPDNGMLTPGRNDGEADTWEIGHLTKGKYALDSWRIFCRDELLGRAADWNGHGREGEFQPEWMRVRPDDKELRACLRWMWMREGWEWDPRTGERTLLREELRCAVNEKRVEYDDVGELRILSEPR
ncbi:hypothetical protein CC79DRAFT_1318655 [Sarocladium strictum]